ncbi:MAG: 2-phospho-L-lactate guanylyltransferase [Actinomycetota bacterium]|nr:2-phospho-L-lactate guanylyltransferase [Actinomycetota bacterium]
MADSHRAPWHLVIPVKGGAGAKTRLRAPDGVDHDSLAVALALDTVVAASGTVPPERVLVVTSGSDVVERLPADIRVLRDPGFGLDAAVRSALAELKHVGHDGWTAVLLGDVPALVASDLDEALDAGSHHERAFVPDQSGLGTVLLMGARPGAVVPRFGLDSARRHEGAGHVRLDLSLPRLRTDVDDEASLEAVLELGVGRHTAHLMAHLLRPSSPRSHERPA